MSERFVAITTRRLDDFLLGYGKTFFVNANAVGGNDNESVAAATQGFGNGWHGPLNSVSAAHTLCTAGNGDRIIVAAEHTETIATDGALDITKADVHVEGLGFGDDRALFTVNGVVGANILVSGAGSSIENVRVSLALDALTAPVVIRGAGSYMRKMEIIEAASCEALDLLSVGAAARILLEDITIEGRNTGDGDALNAIHLNGCDQCTIRRVTARGGDWSEGVLKNESDECLDLIVEDCYFTTEATENILFAFDANATGKISHFESRLGGAGAATEVENAFVLGKVNLGDSVGVAVADGGSMIFLTGGGGGPVTITTGGGSAPTATQHFYVSADGASTGSGESWVMGLDTIKNALTKCTAAEANVIHVDARHAEAIANATDLAINKGDVTIIGEGEGDNRCLLTFGTATTANIPVTGVGATLDNFIITTAGTFDITAGITVSVAGVTIRNCEFRGVDADTDFSTYILTTNAAERLHVENCTFRSAGTLPAAGVGAVGAIDGLVVKGCQFFGKFTTACVDFVTGGSALTNALIDGCYFYNTGNPLMTKNVVDSVTGSTWAAVNCYDGLAGCPFEGGSSTPLRPSAGSLGIKVSKSSATLPQSTAAAIFTVATGRVLVTGIVGEVVTTNIQAQANATKLTANPTAGASDDLCSSLDINGFAIGTLFGNVTGDDAIAATAAGALSGGGFIMEAGTIDLDCAASNTGAMKWDVWYIPLEAGATIAAA